MAVDPTRLRSDEVLVVTSTGVYPVDTSDVPVPELDEVEVAELALMVLEAYFVTHRFFGVSQAFYYKEDLVAFLRQHLAADKAIQLATNLKPDQIVKLIDECSWIVRDDRSGLDSGYWYVRPQPVC